MVAEAAEVHESIRPIALHGHDAQVPAEVAGVAPADGQPIPGRFQKRDSKQSNKRKGGPMATDGVSCVMSCLYLSVCLRIPV